MIKSIQNSVRAVDAAIARLSLSVLPERSALLAFLFHSLFRNDTEIKQNLIDPLQRTTVVQFRQFIEYYLQHGYQFVGPDAIAAGLNPGGKYAAITFDDGYYNNTLALPILKEFNIPAIFFVTGDNVRDNRRFWWDVLYRELIARGMPRPSVYRQGLAQKHLRTHEIEARLTAQFGERAFIPRSDIDRPFSPSELRDFAGNSQVHIGNHTTEHAILTNYSPEEIRSQIQSAQESLREMIGASPIAIAYPNGAYDQTIAQTCQELGLKIGFTTRQRKNLLPIESAACGLMTLGRFSLHGTTPILTQCRTFRSDVQMYGLFRDGYVSLRKRRPLVMSNETDGAVETAPSIP